MYSERVLFKISVVIGDQVQEILVHGNDSPELICEEFAQTHKLSENGKNELLASINSCIEDLAKNSPACSRSPNLQSQHSHELFSRLAQPKRSTIIRSPVLQVLESTKSTKTRFHLLCKLKKHQTPSFKPELNKESLKLAETQKLTPKKQNSHQCLKNSTQPSRSTQTFSKTQAKAVANRLIGYIQVKEKRLDDLRAVNQIEEAKFFKPSILKRPLPAKTPEKKKPDFKFIKDEFRKWLIVGEVEERNRSAGIVEDKKKRRFKEIFQMLNPVGEVLSIGKISFAQVPRELLKVICPLLEELAEIDEGLQFGEFCSAMENLMNVLTIEEKSVILDTKRKSSYKSMDFSFKPQTCKNSFEVKTSLLERSLMIIRKKEMDYKQGQEEKVKIDMKDCTFAPKTTKYIRSKFYPS